MLVSREDLPMLSDPKKNGSLSLLGKGVFLDCGEAFSETIPFAGREIR